MLLIDKKLRLIKTLGISVLICLSNPITAQQNDTTYKYLDGYFKATTQKKMTYLAKVFPQHGYYTMEVTLPSGELVYTAQYSDRNATILHGQYIRYYPNKVKQSAATFVNGKTEGSWMWWHPNGNLMDSGMARNGLKDGTWISWYPNGQINMIASYGPSLAATGTIAASTPTNMAIFHGAYKTFYENGNTESEGRYENNVKAGTWRWYHDNGNLATIEEYNSAGKIASLQCFDTTGLKQGDLCSLNKPAYLKELGDFKTYFGQNFYWPKAVRTQKKKGSVLVSFTVSKEGILKNVQVQGTSKILEEAVKSFLMQLPTWEPAISHNRYVDFEENIEVVYEGKPKFSEDRKELPEMWRPDYINEAMWE